MIVEIEDRSIQEIMQVCVKEEIEFLTRNLLGRPELRQYLWPFVKDQILNAMEDVGLDQDMIDKITTDSKTMKAPSGGAGGSDPSDDGTGRSGGGGGSDPSDDAGRSGGGGGSDPSDDAGRSGGGGGNDLETQKTPAKKK